MDNKVSKVAVLTCSKSWGKTEATEATEALVVVFENGYTQVHCTKTCDKCEYGKLIKYSVPN
jgi:hypothetical protein